MRAYCVKVEVSKQEDGLWRAEAPELPGCFVDAETMREAIANLQECIGMVIDLHLEEGWQLPVEAIDLQQSPLSFGLSVVVDEFKFKRFPVSKRLRPIKGVVVARFGVVEAKRRPEDFTALRQEFEESVAQDVGKS